MHCSWKMSPPPPTLWSQFSKLSQLDWNHDSFLASASQIAIELLCLSAGPWFLTILDNLCMVSVCQKDLPVDLLLTNHWIQTEECDIDHLDILCAIYICVCQNSHAITTIYSQCICTVRGKSTKYWSNSDNRKRKKYHWMWGLKPDTTARLAPPHFEGCTLADDRGRQSGRGEMSWPGCNKTLSNLLGQWQADGGYSQTMNRTFPYV